MANAVTVASPARSRTCTLLIVGPSERLTEARDSLPGIDEAGGLRAVLISTTDPVPGPPTRDDVVTIAGLKAQHVDNAIAALRLSNLPTVIWWRGGPPEGLPGVAPLADRLVLDVADPLPLWHQAPAFFERASISDVRWARLTRWRASMAHFFDMPGIRELASSFTRLDVAGADRDQCRLFAGWLDAALAWDGRVEVSIAEDGRSAPMSAVVLEGPAVQLSLRLLPNTTCVAAEATVERQVAASRVVSLGHQTLASVLSQELRVRSRDLAFEQALRRTLATS